MTATAVPTHIAVSVLASSLLVMAFVVAMARACADLGRRNADLARVLGAVAGGLFVYAVTAFTVTAGVLVGGTGGGFLAEEYGTEPGNRQTYPLAAFAVVVDFASANLGSASRAGMIMLLFANLDEVRPKAGKPTPRMLSRALQSRCKCHNAAAPGAATSSSAR